MDTETRPHLRPFVRNRYFYGKLLDVHHLEMEQDYHNGKRWLLNRLVTGAGVLCGLDIRLTSDLKGVWVTPGIAIDYAGREIVVPRQTEPVPLPAPPPHDPTRHDCEDEYVHVLICFRQCETDPEPIAVDDCGDTNECATSAVQERYKVMVRHGRAPRPHTDPPLSDCMSNGHIDYCALVRRIARGCPSVPADPCIVLGNIRLSNGPQPLREPYIDICVRPIVYTNRLLYDLITTLAREDSARGRANS
jgi:hypothetical protein